MDSNATATHHDPVQAPLMNTASYWVKLLQGRMTQQGEQAKLTNEEVNAIVQIIDRVRKDSSGKVDSDCVRLVDLLKTFTEHQRGPSTGNKPSTNQKSVFNEDQLNILRFQIQAFRYLSNNMPIPPSLQHALDMMKKPAGQVAQERTVEAAVERSKLEATAGDNDVAVSDPYRALRSAGPYSAHRLLIPTIMPEGIDPVSLAQERERRIRNRILVQIANLESLTANQTPSGTNLKALIQLKALRLLEKQKQLRTGLVMGMKKATTLQTAISRSDYRRMKKPSLREIRVTEKLERQQRIDREKKEKQKQLDHLNTIVQHGRELLNLRKAAAQKQLKLGRAVLHWHSTMEKEEQKRQERLTKDRIRALKADDEEAYLKLIDKQKDTRLTHLLQQTDKYLTTLSNLVLDQQADIRSKEEMEISTGDAASGDDDQQDRTDYYSLAHKISEPVTEQPSIIIGGKLRDYQLAGVSFMVSLYNNRLNGILADEMGLGKTIQTIALIGYLMEKKNNFGPYLVIVPLSTITNWELEFEKWAPNITKIVYKGSPNQRRDIQMRQMRPGTFNCLLTTYEYIIKDKAVLSKIKWMHTIIDEGHRMKNAHSKLSVTLSQFYSSRYRIILTGTPLQNNLPELWALLNFVLPKVFNSVKSFDEWFNTPFANTGERIELNEEEQLLIIKRLHKVLRPFLLRRLKKDVEADLPEKTERVLKTPLSPLQQKLYSQIRTSGAMLTGGEGKKAVRSINNTIMQLRKVCNHPFVFEEVENTLNPNHITDDLIIRVSGKFELLDRILPKMKITGHRVLMFFQMTAVMDIMEDFLRLRNFKYLRLDGSTKAEDRSALLKLYNAEDSEYFVFILSTRAGGLGLNLQSADTVVIFDSDWNPHQDLQAQDRAHRLGQKKEVRVFRLISANSIEEQILARAQYKLDMDGKVIQAGKFDNKSTHEERESFLRSLFEQNTEEDSEANELDDEEELNQMLARTDEELARFREYDIQRTEEDNRRWKAAGNAGVFPRLISLDELPEVFLHEEIPVKKEEKVEMGRGRRTKNEVTYDDGLTEEQWTRAIDNEEDINDVVESKRRRREKRQKRKSRDSITRRIEDEDESTEAEDDMSIASSRADLSTLFMDCIAALKDCYEQLPDGSKRCRSDLFLTLPDRNLYPDYYQIIKTPISLDLIEKRVKSNTYSSKQSFKESLELLVRNAKTYNVEGSQVYEDAEELRTLFERILHDSSYASKRRHQESEDDGDEEVSSPKRIKLE